jgi:hypothetical protein
MRHTVLLLAAAVVIAAPLAAQSRGGRSQAQIRALYNGHQADFDYLLGDWEFTGVRRERSGEITFRGVWSAVRMPEGTQILDDYRVVSDTGESFYVTKTLRAYNAFLDRWELVGMDQGNGLQDIGTGHRVGDEIHIEQTFGAMTPQPTILRIRYYDIQNDRFSWTADASSDAGKTWQLKFQEIQARRVGPPRTMERLTPPTK